MRFFNTEGPVRLDKHYAIQPLDRVDIGELLRLIEAERYFVLHAPRQTGKTSALIALRNLLNSGEAGSYRCVDVNVESAQVVRDDVARGMRAILNALAMNARRVGDNYPDEVWPERLGEGGTGGGIEGDARPLVRSEPCAAGAAGGRDRLAGRRHSALGAAPAPRRLPAPPGGFPAKHRSMRGSATSGTTASARAPARSSPAAAHSTWRRSRCAWATSPRRRRSP